VGYGATGTLKSDGRSAAPGEPNLLAKEFVEFVVRSDPGPRITMPFADHTNISAYSHRPIIWVTAKFFESKRIVSGILQQQSKGAPSRLFAWHSIPRTPAKSSE